MQSENRLSEKPLKKQFAIESGAIKNDLCMTVGNFGRQGSSLIKISEIFVGLFTLRTNEVQKSKGKTQLFINDVTLLGGRGSRIL